MESEFERINLGFSTADAEIISINFSPTVIELKMIDWHEKKYKIIFEDVLAYSFQFRNYEEEYDYRNDETYIVKNSEWFQTQIESYSSNAKTEKTDHLRHYKLCFNWNDEELNIICSKKLVID